MDDIQILALYFGSIYHGKISHALCDSTGICIVPLSGFGGFFCAFGYYQWHQLGDCLASRTCRTFRGLCISDYIIWARSCKRVILSVCFSICWKQKRRLLKILAQIPCRCSSTKECLGKSGGASNWSRRNAWHVLHPRFLARLGPFGIAILRFRWLGHLALLCRIFP